ncbi:hypothetical protein [Tabrizicola sp.]|uniref:hypothetical protein n=1 Tax=Tabrizicola sp. TaxID=2005166 RepID=UPI0027333632|nr:hypothetical protein [Tabrizicola sp.]MDP3194312.1 hypothetical protein [Tabrizicola sp.]MDZ4057124.1 hypothetical protein [Polynucleobacter sp.]
MKFAEYARQDSDYLKAAGRLYKVFFILLLVAYFLPTSLLAFTSFGRNLTSSLMEASPDSFFQNQILLLNGLGPQFGITYLAQAVIYSFLPPCFAVLLARASNNLILKAKVMGHAFPELPKLSLFSIFLSLASFAPLLFSGYISAATDRSIADRVVLWPVSVSITLGASFFMLNGLHLLFLAAKLAAIQPDRR